MKQRRKLQYKILFNSYLIMLTAVFTISAIVIFSMKQNAEKDIASYRNNAIEKVKNNLKNYVSLAYEC